MAFLTAGSLFQHTAARRRLATKTGNDGSAAKVSTHSRPKAAGYRNNAAQVQNTHIRAHATQWMIADARLVLQGGGGGGGPGGQQRGVVSYLEYVSTHSRPKAAGFYFYLLQFNYKVSTHSRPKAAGDAGWYHVLQFSVSTHSRPKAAGCLQPDAYSYWPCFNTQPPEGGWGERIISGRRLNSFNTQPPEGGWSQYLR